MAAKSKRERIKYSGIAGNKHIPSKAEAKRLRKICAENHLTEEEVRSIKKFRKELSSTQKQSKYSKTQGQRFLMKDLKSVTQRLKLPWNHPLVMETLLNELKEKSMFSFRSYCIGITKINNVEELKRRIESIKTLQKRKDNASNGKLKVS